MYKYHPCEVDTNINALEMSQVNTEAQGHFGLE